jgi:transcriptional regulator with XRE-family HTH domain
MAGIKLGSVGDYIREQRNAAQYSLRQLAQAAGVSNPYLSQIERGLRRPSAEILQQIAKALRISAETLYVRAGILDDTAGGFSDAAAAIMSDAALTERQKRVLIDIYDSFRKENDLARERVRIETEAPDAATASEHTEDFEHFAGDDAR